MSNAYDIGDRVRITVTFSVASVATDPTTVTARFSRPDGLETDYTYPTVIAKDSTGVYHFDIDPTIPGWYYYRFAGSGAVVAAGEGGFSVRPSLA